LLLCRGTVEFTPLRLPSKGAVCVQMHDHATKRASSNLITSGPLIGRPAAPKRERQKIAGLGPNLGEGGRGEGSGAHRRRERRTVARGAE
jgi:hypothetical protein